MKVTGIVLGLILISSLLVTNQIFAVDSKNKDDSNKKQTQSTLKKDKSKDIKIKSISSKKPTKNTYNNQEYGFSIEYPKDWFKREYPIEGIIVQISANVGGFFSNPMIIVMYRHDFNIEDNPNSLNDDKTINELLRYEIGNSKITNKKIESIPNGKKATVEWIMPMEDSLGITHLRKNYAEFYYLKNGDSFTVGYVADQEDYEKYFNKAKESIKTFKPKI